MHLQLGDVLFEIDILLGNDAKAKSPYLGGCKTPHHGEAVPWRSPSRNLRQPHTYHNDSGESTLDQQHTPTEPFCSASPSGDALEQLTAINTRHQLQGSAVSALCSSDYYRCCRLRPTTSKLSKIPP